MPRRYPQELEGHDLLVPRPAEARIALPLVYNQKLTLQLKGHSLALDENIYQLRREKLKKIESLGHPAYPRKYNFSHTVPQILAEYSGQTTEELESPRVTVRVAGRIMAIRLIGKAGVAQLQQDG